jgi:hypothetical protein
MRQKERSERNQRVVLMRITQVPVKDIAEMMGLTDRQIRRIMANWREGSLKEETDHAAETVRLILETTRDDIKALSIAAANEPPETQFMIQGMKMERLQKNIQVLLDTGFSFEGLFKNRSNDFELITDVNAAIRKTLESGGVDPEVVEASMEASLDAFATWGYGPLTEADI